MLLMDILKMASEKTLNAPITNKIMSKIIKMDPTYKNVASRMSKLEAKDLKVGSIATEEASKLAGEQKGKDLLATIDGPVKKALIGIGGVFATAQLMDSSHKAIEQASSGKFSKFAEEQQAKQDKQRQEDEVLYEQEMEEATKNGLFIDYTADATKNKYKPLGYQPGLPGDPNLNIVQDLYSKRTNHTRM